MATAKKVLIELSEGSDNAVVRTGFGVVEVSKTIPVVDLPELLAASVRTAGEPASTTKLNPSDLKSWEINLFPRWGYAMLGDKRANGEKLTVGVLSPEIKTIFWESGKEPKELVVMIPARVWVARWSGGFCKDSFLHTFSGRGPTGVNDSITPIHPWKMGNVDTNGWMCWGTTNRVQFGADGISNVDLAFFTSAFNDHIHRNGDRNLYRWWRDEVEKAGGMKAITLTPAHPKKEDLPHGFAPLIPHDDKTSTNLVKVLAYVVGRR